MLYKFSLNTSILGLGKSNLIWQFWEEFLQSHSNMYYYIS